MIIGHRIAQYIYMYINYFLIEKVRFITVYT